MFHDLIPLLTHFYVLLSAGPAWPTELGLRIIEKRLTQFLDQHWGGTVFIMVAHVQSR